MRLISQDGMIDVPYENLTEKKKQIGFLTIFIILQIVQLKEILTM